jgi:two-component system sensor histidine kinase PhoQ
MALAFLKSLSIRRRLMLSAALVLAVFLGLAGFTLDEYYRQTAFQSLERELQGHVYTLLSAAKENAEGLPVMDTLMPNPDMNIPGSGLYASMKINGSDSLWKSASLEVDNSQFLVEMDPGEKQVAEKDNLMILSYGVAWEDFSGKPVNYTFSVASELTGVHQDLRDFRYHLVTWFGGSAIVLILGQLLVLHWGTRPLQQAASEIKRIENGELERLEGEYPLELQGLTANINSLIEHVSANQQRYRNRLGDLAHSLKTPLALIQAARESNQPDELSGVVDEQLPRIDQLIQYQLQRAAVMGKATLGQSVLLGPLVEKIIRGLSKVYRDKGIDCQITIDPALRFQVDETDLMELLGNLLDNAFKYGHSRILVSANRSASGHSIYVEDDGEGISQDDIERLLQRGARADEKMPGQGIGLDIVNEIMRLYRAQLSVSKSQLGGAALHLYFPR